MSPIIYNGLVLAAMSMLVGCGLKYVPDPQLTTYQNSEVARKLKVEQYIWDSYKNTSLRYHPIVFGPTSTVKPPIFHQLDSLYEMHYFNEQIGRRNIAVEHEIKALRAKIASKGDVITYIEHHVYGIQDDHHITIYYADIQFGANAVIHDFTITTSYEIDSVLLPLYTAYITHESILYPNYQPNEEERKLYAFFETELHNRPSYEQNKFLNHMLHVFAIARQIKSVETKGLLQYFTMNYAQKHEEIEQNTIDKIESLWQEDTLIGYAVQLANTSYLYNSYLELIEQSTVSE